MTEPQTEAGRKLMDSPAYHALDGHGNCGLLALILAIEAEAVASLTAQLEQKEHERQDEVHAHGLTVEMFTAQLDSQLASSQLVSSQLEQAASERAALVAALEEVRTAAAWRDDLNPQERLRMCLVASRTVLADLSAAAPTQPEETA